MSSADVRTLQEHGDSIAQMKTSCEENAADIERVSNVVNAHESRLGGIDAEVSTLQSKVDENTTRISQINSTLAEHTESISQINTELNNKDNEIAQINTKLEEHTESINAKITTDRIEDGAVTSEKIATSAFDSTLSVSGKIAPADVVGGKLTELGQETTKAIDDTIIGEILQNGQLAVLEGNGIERATETRSGFINKNGNLVEHANFQTAIINVAEYKAYKINVPPSGSESIINRLHLFGEENGSSPICGSYLVEYLYNTIYAFFPPKVKSISVTTSTKSTLSVLEYDIANSKTFSKNEELEQYLYKRYNAQNIKNNCYQNYINGNIISSIYYFVIEGIPVRGYEKIDIARTVNSEDNAMGIVFYGSDGTTKVGGNGLFAESINTIIVPDGAVYANLTISKSVYDSIEQLLFQPYPNFSSRDLDKKIAEIDRPEFDINSNPISGEFIRAIDGVAVSHSAYNRTDYIELFKGSFLFKLNFGLNLTSVVAIAFYDENKDFVFSIGGQTSSSPSYVEQEVDFSEHPNVRYFRASLYGSNLYAYCKKIDSININIEDEAITTSKIKDGAVTSSKIKDEAVTEQKTIFFEHDPNSNFIDRNKLTPGYYIAANGVPMRAYYDNYFITDKVFLTEGETYYKGNLFGGYCAFYREDGTLVQGYGAADTLPNPFVVPQNAVYGRFTLNVAGADKTCWISNNIAPADYKLVIKRTLIPAEESTPKNYSGREISTFAKIMCIGDSLTEGAFNYLVNGKFGNGTTAALLGRPYSYPQYLAKLTGCEVTNLGKSGFTSTQWYDYYTTGEGADTDFSGYDCAIIQLGVNDSADTLDTITKTALDNIINKVKAVNAGIKIFLAGIINAKSYPAATEGEAYYAKDQWLRNYYNTYYANDTQVFFIDHVTYGHLRSMPNAQHEGSYPVDNYNEGHLSAYGYWRLAQDYVSIIGYIMSHNNAQDFRKIQFIGTTYQCY